MKQIVGIDLGTTNSEVAIVKDGHPTVIADKQGKYIVPSVVGCSPEGEILVGELARNQYVLSPEHTIKSIKRRMGSEERVQLADKNYTPQEISAFILKRLKSVAEEHLGTAISQAVITVPAYFSDKQRQATKDAGEIAGLEVMRIINEPTAAALAYGLDQEEDQFLIVYDLGGGTFDVSVIEINSGVIEVRASRGNTQLGGDDFDAALVNHIVEEFKKKHEIDLCEQRRAMARLTKAAEQAKIQLSNAPFAQIKEEFIATKDDKPLHLEMEIERSLFESLIQEMLESTMKCVEEALQDASMEAENIDKVLLVGGSTRIPVIADMIQERFGIEPNIEINPDLCVAMGASVQAAIIAGEEIDAVLVDVAPHSLGIETCEFDLNGPIFDQYSILIRRNTAIPVSKSEVYTTFSPDQEKVTINVYQGDEVNASENTFLGEFVLEGVKKTSKGWPEIIVNFDYDINGIVHVSAEDKKTGKKQQITVVATPDSLTEEEKAQASENLAEMDIVAEGDDSKSHQHIIALRDRAVVVCESLDDDKQKSKLQKIIDELNKALEEENQKLSQLQEQLLDTLYDLEE